MMREGDESRGRVRTKVALVLSMVATLLAAIVAIMAPLRATEKIGHLATLTPQAALTPRPSASLPDLVPVNLWFGLAPGSTWCMGPEWRVGIEATVANQGEEDAGEFVVEVNHVAQTVIGGLRAHEERRLFFYIGWYGETTCSVDTTYVVDESNESNNTLSVFIPVLTPPPPCTPTPGLWWLLPIIMR